MKRPLNRTLSFVGVLTAMIVLATVVLPMAVLPALLPAALPRVYAADAPAPPFTDIAGNWAEAEIYALHAQGIVTPKTGTEFRPNDKITRAEFCGFITRAVGLPVLPYAALFTDVGAAVPEVAAIEAANLAGIVQGTGEGHFSPGGLITREQMAAMFLRAYLYASRQSSTAGGGSLAFADAARISPWALEAVKFAASSGLIRGRDGGLFAPLDAATRAEAAVMVQRLLTIFPEIAAARAEPAPAIFAGSVLSLAVAPSDPEVIYAGGGEWGGVIKSSDGGQTWTDMHFNEARDAPQGDVREVVVDSDDRDLVTITTDAAGAWPAGVMQSHDGGNLWDRMGNFKEDALSVRGLAALPSGRMIASGYGGLRFAANGTNFRWAYNDGDTQPNERLETAAGNDTRPFFGYAAYDPADEKLVLASAYYEKAERSFYNTIYISRSAGYSWDSFLTVDLVKPIPGWRAIAFIPGDASHSFVVGTDVYTAASPDKVRAFIDEGTVPGLAGAYRPGADGRLLRVMSYSFAPVGGVYYALASATTLAGLDATIILRSSDGGKTWVRHEAVLPAGSSSITAMAVAFAQEPGRPEVVYLSDRGQPFDPADPAHNLVGHIYRATVVAADSAWTFKTVYTNREP
ncbi:MAG: S-layer homology domain-containing protein [Bacillota bacterium]